MSSRILIVDDTPTVLDFLELVFERQGFEVVKALSGEQALRLAVEAEPDVLLIDVMMPGMDGLEVCRRLRADPATTHLPLLLYSAVVGNEIEAQARAAGADEFLGKTLHHAELVNKVRDWMAARARPGGVGVPALVEVCLDLAGLLQVEWVWLVGDRGEGFVHLAVAAERGEQEAVRFLQTVGKGPYPVEGETVLGVLFEHGRLKVQWALEEIRALRDGGPLAEAVARFNARALFAAPLRGPAGERAALFFSSPPTLALDSRTARAVAVALRYATASVVLWGGLTGAPALPAAEEAA